MNLLMPSVYLLIA